MYLFSIEHFEYIQRDVMSLVDEFKNVVFRGNKSIWRWLKNHGASSINKPQNDTNSSVFGGWVGGRRNED